MRICRQRGTSMPKNVVIMGDNTVRELKNQLTLSYLTQLCARHKFRLLSLHFLRKNHTRDRIDQVWGVLSRRIARTDSLLTADDTVRCLEDELLRPRIRHWLGATTAVHVSKLNCVRDWKSNWKDIGITYEGGLLVDSTANHVFVLLRRGGWAGNFQKANICPNQCFCQICFCWVTVCLFIHKNKTYLIISNLM